MEEKSPATWPDAFKAGPGPRSMREALLLALKGLCMGSADIIPGVSGGTIALITGIYQDLLQAIKSANTRFAKCVLRLEFKAALAGLHLRFLLSLFAGIGVAIVSLARLMNFLLIHYPVYTWSLFFGLIAASIFVVGKQVGDWTKWPLLFFAAGSIVAFFVVSLIPVSTPEAFWFIFLAGFIAICAMILPGLSGAFILLILGKYTFITATLKNPFLPQNLMIIIVFCAGCLAGLLCFSRALSFLLDRYHQFTLAFLTGMMAGSMKKIWPWKEVIESTVIRGNIHVLREKNVLPEALDGELLFALFLAIVGFSVVIVLDRLSGRRD